MRIEIRNMRLPAALEVLFTILPSLLIVAYYQSFLFDFTCEDAYISMRYALNLAKGQGLVFNVGEPVEGYSNFLWTILLFASSFLHSDVVYNSKIMGLSSLFGTLGYAVLIVRKLGVHPVFGGIAVTLFIALNTSLNYYASSGLETVFMTFLITAGTYHALTWKTSAYGFLSSVLFFTAAALSRPEGILVLVLAIGFRLVSHLFTDDKMKRLDWISVSFGILVYAGFLVFRHVYYNSWLPNTFFAKPQDWIGGRAFPLGGIDYTNIFHHRNGGPLLIPLILLLITKKHAVQGILFVLGVLGCALAFVFYANVDWMSNERFFVPYIGVLYTFALSPLMIRTNLVAVHPLAKTAAVGAIILFFGLDQITRLDQMETSKDTYPLHLMSCVRLDGIGKDLKRRFHGRGVLATKRIGAIPFYSGLRIVDAYGLADKEIARIYYEKPSGQRRRMAVRAAFRRNPTMVLSYTTRRLRHPQKSSSKDAHMFHGLDRYLFEEAMKRKFRFVKEYQSSRTEWAYLFVKRL